MAFLQAAGARHAPLAPRHSAAVLRAAERARAQWLDALVIDETRTWMSLGERQPEILSGMATVLTLAGFVHVFDTRRDDTPDLRVIRGAISAAPQLLSAAIVALDVCNRKLGVQARLRAVETLKAAIEAAEDLK